MHLSNVSTRPIVAAPSRAVNVLLRYVVALACAVSAGVHAALVPDHWAEGGPGLGGAFAACALASAVLGVAVRRPERDGWAPAAAAAVLAATVLAYGLSRTAGLPLLVSGPEALDPLGVLTSAAEVLGALSGLLLTIRKDPA
jgi:hypothetical protein